MSSHRRDHLAGIAKGSVPSHRHRDFKDERRAVRDKLEGQGTRLITSEELVDELMTWLAVLYKKCNKNKFFADTKYVAYVLTPEAILYGLHKIKGISMEAAQALMDMGPWLTHEEWVWYRNP
ncbi:uncharacterized protein LOC144919574 [Branchiostoma floridae x Branchiostoma belcheri]